MYPVRYVSPFTRPGSSFPTKEWPLVPVNWATILGRLRQHLAFPLRAPGGQEGDAMETRPFWVGEVRWICRG